MRQQINKQPYEYIVLGTSVRIIITARNQTLKVTREQINNQLQKADIDPSRRKMYLGALAAMTKR